MLFCIFPFEAFQTVLITMYVTRIHISEGIIIVQV